MDPGTPGQFAAGRDCWRRTRTVIAQSPPEATVAVAALDHASGARLEHCAQRPFPAASTVKLLILVAVDRSVQRGERTLTDLIEVRKDQKVAGSGVLNWLTSDLWLTVRDLSWLMIAISDNTASNLLMDEVGLDAIADIQTSLNLQRTKLARHFMRPVPGGPQNLVTAADLVTVLDAIRADAAACPASAWMMEMLADQQIRDRLARHLPESVSFAGKSGWQAGISHDSGLLRGPHGGVTVAVLTEGLGDPHEAAAYIGAIGRAIVEDTGIAS
jgi:beta-lactamase class A